MKPSIFKSSKFYIFILIILFGLSCEDEIETIKEPEELESG